MTEVRIPESPRAGEPAARSPVECLLRARSVAIVGASGRVGSFGHTLLVEAVNAGFDGAIYPVNPGYRQIEGVDCYPSLADVPGPVDCVALALANERLEAGLADAARHGARSAVIFASAYEPPAPGRRPLTERLAAIAREAGMALCGANCMGFYNFRDRLMICGFPHRGDRTPGTIGLITHSGSAFSALANNQRQLAFSYMISSGQELVTTAADYLRFLVGQPETTVVGCFLETVRDPAGFIAALELAAERDVPVVVLKVGRSERGRLLAQSHSGALAGDDAAYQAVFERYNVVRVGSLDELADTLELFASKRRPTTGAIAIGTDSGGERGLVVDVANDLGIPLAEIAPATTRRLADVLEPGLDPVNPVDLWGTGLNYEEVCKTCLQAFDDDPAVGATVLAVDLVPGRALLQTYVAVAEQLQQTTKKPFIVMGNLASTIDRAAAARLRAQGIPVLMGTITGLSAIKHLLTYQAGRRAQSAEPPFAPAVDAATIDAWRARLRETRGAALDEHTSKQLLATFGLPVTREEVVTSVDGAIAAARRLGFPVVLKTAMPGILHKSDRGGVILGVDTVDAVRQAYARLQAAFGPTVLVQEQVRPGVEVLFGMVNDAQFGPLVTVGLGGVFVEVFRDVVTLLPPVTPAQALERLKRLRSYPLLTGARGGPAANLAALAEAIARFSVLCVELGPLLGEVDVNPVIAGPTGVVAVDALVVPRPGMDHGEQREVES